MIEFCGYTGAILLAICGLPQAIQAWQEGHARGINSLTAAMWFWGEIFIIIYVLPTSDIPLLFNYLCNLVIISTIVYYKLRPRS